MKWLRFTYLAVVSVILSSCTTTSPTDSASATAAPEPTQLAHSTETPLPAPSSQTLLDPNSAIMYSRGLLLKAGLEQGDTYGYTAYVPVQFPDTNSGAFVVICKPCCIEHCYQFLYRLNGDQFHSVVLKRDWRNWESVETVNLLSEATGYSRQILKLTGFLTPGTRLLLDGYFEIIDVTDGSIRVIFSGYNVDLNGNEPGGWYRQNTYQYIDLDGDGYKEIIEEGKECSPFFNEQAKEWEPAPPCKTTRKVYHFDGTEYVKQ